VTYTCQCTNDYPWDADHKEQQMTIAAGFHCSDGIVICADTEQTDQMGKYQREKIFNFQDQLILTGAGHSDFIKMAFDKLCDEYRLSQPSNPSDARVIVERMILDLYEKHIFRFYQAGDLNRPSIDLIIAMRCSSGQPAMIKTLETATVLGGFFESVGIGKPLFEYWAQLLYWPTLTMDIVSFLCAFILQEVKRNVYACGGHSLVFGMPRDASRTGKMVASPDGAVFAGFPHTVVPLLAQCRDLHISDEEFESSIKKFVLGFKIIRQQERMARNANEIMTHGLPMPDAPLGSEETSKKIEAAKEQKLKSPPKLAVHERSNEFSA